MSPNGRRLGRSLPSAWMFCFRSYVYAPWYRHATPSSSGPSLARAIVCFQLLSYAGSLLASSSLYTNPSLPAFFPLDSIQQTFCSKVRNAQIGLDKHFLLSVLGSPRLHCRVNPRSTIHCPVRWSYLLSFSHNSLTWSKHSASRG